MRLFHFSDNPGIYRFEPRPVLQRKIRLRNARECPRN